MDRIFLLFDRIRMSKRFGTIVVMISLFQNICIHMKFFGVGYIFSRHSNSSWNSWKQSILLLFPFFEMLETCWLAKGEGFHVSLRLKYFHIDYIIRFFHIFSILQKIFFWWLDTWYLPTFLIHANSCWIWSIRNFFPLSVTNLMWWGALLGSL